MNDSPGWATPGSSPSDGERPGTPADQPGTDGGAQQPGRPAGDPKWSAEQPPPGQWSSPGTTTPETPPTPPQPAAGGWGQRQDTPYAGQSGPQYGYPGGPGQWGSPRPPSPV